MCNKRQHKTVKAAKDHLLSVRARNEVFGYPKNGVLRVYPCPLCRSFTLDTNSECGWKGMTPMEFHEICKTFPEMSEDELKDLESDIAKNGLVNPIWIYEGQIIDGRHRHHICRSMGIVPEYREWNGECGSLLRFVVSANLHRRQLTAGQRAAIAAETKPAIEAEIQEEMIKKQAKEARRAVQSLGGVDLNRMTIGCLPKIGNGLTSTGGRNARAEAACLMGVSNGYVSDALRIKEASPEIFEDVKANRLTISEAKRKLSQNFPEKPKRATEDPGNMIKVMMSPDPVEASRVLLQYFQGDRLRALIAELADHANLAIAAPSLAIRDKIKPDRIDDDVKAYLAVAPTCAR